MASAIAAKGGWGRRIPIRPSAVRFSFTWRVTVALAAIAVAYHYSLITLIRNVGLETPLAYLGLVPFIALVLAVSRSRLRHPEPSIHDRQLDYIIGIPLMLAALGIVFVLPVQMSTVFWTRRIDLLSLPLFVAGVVAVMFGVRALWRLRLPIAFLLLAWPVPYTFLVENWLEGFTNITVAALGSTVGVLGVAEWLGGADGSLFAVTHGTEQFVLSVAAACAGVNGMVGFILVGTAFTAIVEGRRLPKLIWLAGGLVLLWALNVGRILLIFAGGQRWGERAAVEWLHPYVGLVAFNLGVIVMILAMPLFGLHFRRPQDALGDRGNDQASGQHLPAVARTRPALAIIVVAGLTLGAANMGLRQYGLVAGDLGEARLVAFSQEQGRPEGWKVSQTGSFDWAQRYFGEDSLWNRYTYLVDRNSPSSPFRSSVPVTADVISTSDLNTFATYGLQACYDFHGFEIRDVHSVDLGGGITGEVISHYQPDSNSDWTTLYWHWPVDTGTGTRYERVVLMMNDTANAEVTAPAPDLALARQIGLGVDNSSRGQADNGALDEKLTATRTFLVGFGQAIVREQAGMKPSGESA